MAVTTVGSFPAIGVKVMEEGAPVLGDNTFTHDLPFTPKVYAVAQISSAGTGGNVVKSEGATTVVITTITTAGQKLRVVLGP